MTPRLQGAPAALRPGLEAIYSHYDVRPHGNPDGVNARQLADWPADPDHLLGRFATVVTPQVSRRG